MDRKISRLWHGIATHYTSIRKKVAYKINPFTLAGSISEGGFSSRLFAHHKLFPHHINKQVEFDLEIQVLNFKPEARSFFHDDKDKPGFVRLEFGNYLMQYVL